MTAIEDIKKRARMLASKTESNSITPEEVGNLIYDTADFANNVERNGGSLGIRKTYTSVSAMEADSTSPVDLWGNPMKKGNLCVIYDGTSTGSDNNKVFAFTDPGWEFITTMEAGYARIEDVELNTADIQELQNAVWPVTVTISVSPNIIEVGIKTEITLKWNVYRKGNDVSDESTMTLNGEEIYSTAANYNIMENEPKELTYTLKAVCNNITGSATAKVSVILPLYFGFSSGEQAVNIDITSLGTKNLKLNPAGTYTINNTESGNYMWLCVPEGMKINKVTMNGFDVPMESAQSASTSKGTYNCYRSSNALVAGSYTIVIP